MSGFNKRRIDNGFVRMEELTQSELEAAMTLAAAQAVRAKEDFRRGSGLHVEHVATMKTLRLLTAEQRLRVGLSAAMALED